jgi:hypothetical protein
MDQFIGAKTWFDATEYSKDREYSHPFPRVQKIKEILFRLHAG